MNYVWFKEIFIEGEWYPSIKSFSTRKEARKEVKQDMQNTGFKFRVVKYVREEK